MLASSTTWSHLHARSPCVFHEFRIAGERPPAPSIFATTPLIGIGNPVRWWRNAQLDRHAPVSRKISDMYSSNHSVEVPIAFLTNHLQISERCLLVFIQHVR